jgi:hypothetical protein
VNRILTALGATALALCATVTGGAGAQADVGHFWHACNSERITWTMNEARGVTGVPLKAERALMKRNLAKITAVTKGRYRFTYVPTGPVTIDWAEGGSAPYLAYTTAPATDLLFAYLEDGRAAKGKPATYQYDGSKATTFAKYYPWVYADGTRDSLLREVPVFFDPATVMDDPATDRQALYMWAALKSLGVRNPAQSVTLNARDASLLKAQASMSCSAVAAHPAEGPGHEPPTPAEEPTP